MKKIFLVLLLCISMMSMTLAADFTPQGDINLREVYAIKGATIINATGNISTLSWFEGLFNWTTVSNFLSFSGHTLTLNDTLLNDSINNSIDTRSGSINVNSSNYWDDYGVAGDLNNLITIQGENISGGTINFDRLPSLTNKLTLDWANITNKFITAVDNIYIYMSGTTATLNETKLNQTISLIDTATNTSMKTYVDGTFITQADEGNLNVNSSNYWDDMNTINSTQLEDSAGTLNIKESWISSLWCRLTGCNLTGNLNVDGNLTANYGFVSYLKDVNYIDFNTSYDQDHQEGRIHWNSEEGTLEIDMPGGEVRGQVFQEMFLPNRPKNVQGETILNGKVVYISGATSNIPEVKLVNNSIQTLAMKTVAVATEDVLDNQRGFYTAYGIVRDINTSSWAEGDWLYIDSTNGDMTNVKPLPPLSKVRIGVVTRSHATEGAIFVMIDKVRHLDGLSNVNTTETINNTILQYDLDNEVWQETTNPIFDNVTADYFKGDLEIDYLSGSSNTTIQDYINSVQSAGRIFGGDFSDNGDGTITVSAGLGFIKTTNNDIGNTVFFEWETNSSVPLYNGSISRIYVDYNGGNPVILRDGALNHNTEMSLGSAFLCSLTNEVHLLDGGTPGYNLARLVHYRLREPGIQKISGALLGEPSGLNLSVTEGVFWAGLNRFTTGSFDSTGLDNFSYFYQNGSNGWYIQEGISVINNTHYDDETGTLAELTVNKYGVHWVYNDNDGHIFILYGYGDYVLGGASNAEPPLTVPTILSEFGTLLGKIIVQKGAITFTEILSVLPEDIPPSVVTEHGELSGLGDDDHIQYLLADGLRELSANWNAGVYNITASWFKGIFNWVIGTGSNYLSFNGTTLDFNETFLNLTIDDRDLDTNASTACSGTTTYLDGEGNCDDISGVYAPVGYGDDWNKTYADTLYADISVTGDNSSWNETYANTLYADISVTGDNSTWNQSLADTLYRVQSWDNFTGIPTATPSDGDTTHLSTADQIRDYVIGLGYSTTTGTVTSVATDDTYLTGGAITTTGTITFNTTLAGTSLSVNSSDYWDSLGSPSDINAADITDDGTYRLQSWNNLTGIPHATPSDGDTTHFSLADEIYDWVIGLGYIASLVADTTPQLGGYLDTNGQNIGSTADEIENVYVATNSRIYFGDGQEASVYYNGTVLIIG